MALLDCIENPITLEIYLDQSGNAYGWLYLDDGETLNYKKHFDASTLIEFKYESNTLTSSFIGGSDYTFPKTQKVSKIVIYGLKTAPAIVLGANVEIDYLYDDEKQALFTGGFQFTFD